MDFLRNLLTQQKSRKNSDISVVSVEFDTRERNTETVMKKPINTAITLRSIQSLNNNEIEEAAGEEVSDEIDSLLSTDLGTDIK